jgi:hypothetical protein
MMDDGRWMKDGVISQCSLSVLSMPIFGASSGELICMGVGWLHLEAGVDEI